MLRSVDGAGKPGCLQDGFSNLIGRKNVGMNGNMRHAVERKAALIARCEVGMISKNGTRVLGSAAAG